MFPIIGDRSNNFHVETMYIFVKVHDLHGTFSYFIIIFVPDSDSSPIPFMHYDEICFFVVAFLTIYYILHSFVKKKPWFASSHFP